MMEIQPLPFGFARRHAVLLDPSTAEDGSGVIVYSQQPLSLPLYSELRRYAKVPLKIERLSTDRFQKAMSELYEASSIQSRQSMEGIGDELELPSLAESMQEAEDLLEQEDEAPIIRLINAVLAEAIQSQASDIHLETFEKSLSVRFRVDGMLKEVARPRRELAHCLFPELK